MTSDPERIAAIRQRLKNTDAIESWLMLGERQYRDDIRYLLSAVETLQAERDAEKTAHDECAGGFNLYQRHAERLEDDLRAELSALRVQLQQAREAAR